MQYSAILIAVKIDYFQMINSDIFCGFSLDLPQLGSSNVYRITTIYVLSKNNVNPVNPSFTI